MKIKEVPIEYIKIQDNIKGIRAINEEAVGRYMEKYESGTSKPILVKEINRKEYILIDGKHRLEAKNRLKNRKIDCELTDLEDKELYAKAVECNVEHGVPLNDEEEIEVLKNLIGEGRTQKKMADIFHISQQAISKRIKSNKILKKQLSSKVNIPTVNEFLEGKKQSEIANNYDITQGRVSQIWGDFVNEITSDFNAGTPKQEIIKNQSKNGINLTEEKINELIKEDYNKVILGNCLDEIPKLKDNSIDCVIIDPPYGIDYQSNFKKEKHEKIDGDRSKAFNLLDKSLTEVKPKLKKDSHIYIFTSWKVYEKVKPIVEKYFTVKNCLIWNKTNWSMGDLKGNYAEKYEMIIFAIQGNRKLLGEKRPVNVLDCSHTDNSEHPTQKPVELIKVFIENSTKESEVILDFFAGSGSTLLASKELKRKWIGIESEKEYFEVCNKELINLEETKEKTNDSQKELKVQNE